MNFQKITAMLTLLAALLSFSSCAAAGPKQTENAVSFTDALGRRVTVEKAPNSVAALIGSFADIWSLSGGSVCATAEDAWEDFDLDLKDAVSIGGAHSPSLELLLASDPELVIASASTSSNVEMRETLENAGITVAYFDVDNFCDYLSMLDICTDITGRKDLYKQNGLDIKARIDAVKKEVAESDLTEKERTILLLRASSGSVKAKGSEGTILGEMLSDLGCTNIADSDTSLLEALSVESVIRRDPHRIFAVTMGNDTEKAVSNLKQLLNGDPAWGGLSAVKEERLHIMERRLFNIKPNVKWAEAYEKLRDILLEEK